MADASQIVYCRCAYSQQVAAEVKDGVLAALAGSDAPFEAVADLCELAARRDPALARWAAADGLKIVACHARAVKWLFHVGGAELGDAAEKVLDMKSRTADQITACLPIAAAGGDGSCARAGEGPGDAVEVVLYEGPGARPLEAQRRLAVLTALLDAGNRVTRPAPGASLAVGAAPVVVLGDFVDGRAPGIAGEAADGRVQCFDLTDACPCSSPLPVHKARQDLNLPQPGAWIPWFPVLDYDRCAGCKQCASFCLFGVYEIDEDDRVRVAHPANCKTNCPACARLCRQVAIIFPKYASRPYNGEEVSEADVQRGRAATDLKERLRSDVYAVLRQRGRGVVGLGDGAARRPTPADLARMAKELEIPLDALESLKAGGCACTSQAAGRDGDAGDPADPPCCNDTPQAADEPPCCQGGASRGREVEPDGLA